MSASDTVTTDPLMGFRFIVNIMGLSGLTLGFQSVRGISMGMDVLTWAECTDPVTPIKLPKEIAYGDVTLARGVSTTRYIIDWWDQVVEASKNGSWGTYRKDVSIEVYPKGYRSGASGGRTIKVLKAFPSKFLYTDLDAEVSEVLVESLVLTNEGIVTA